MGYDYQIGIIRAKESNLLKKSDWDRIFEFLSLRNTWNELVRIDLGYKEIGNSSEIVNNIGKFYSSILINHYLEITGYFNEESLKKSFLYEFDLFNIKLIYKQKVFPNINFANENSFINAGYLKTQDILDYLKDGILINNLTDNFFDDILKILKDDKIILSPIEFDILLDDSLFAFRVNAAKKLKIDFVVNFWKIQIDFYNLKLLIDKNFRFIKNGFISIENWHEIKDNSIEAKISFFEKYGYKNIAEKVFLSEESAKMNTASWEVAEENYILEFCEKAVAYSLSCEPIFGYFYRRYAEIKNINRLLYGRAFKVSTAMLEQQISKSYIF